MSNLKMLEPTKSAITLAYLQAGVTIPGVGLTITTLEQGKGYTLTKSPEGIIFTKGNIEALIPWTNVKVAVIKTV